MTVPVLSMLSLSSSNHLVKTGKLFYVSVYNSLL